MAYERLNLKSGDLISEKVFKNIDDSFQYLYDNLGEIEEFSLDMIGESSQVSGAIKGSIGSEIIISPTGDYHYIIMDIGIADSFLVETYTSTSKTYLNYGFVLDKSNIILETYCDNATTPTQGKRTFTIDNLPENAAKIAILVYSRTVGAIKIHPQISDITLGKYVRALRDKNELALAKVELLSDAIGAKEEVYDLGNAITSDLVVGGLKGTVGSALQFVDTTVYRYYIVEVGDATHFETKLYMSSSTNYPHYVFFLNDENIVLGLSGKNEDLVVQEVSFTVEDFPVGTTKVAFLTMHAAADALSIHAYQRVFYLTNIGGGGGGGVGQSMSQKQIAQQLDIKRPIIIERNSTAKYLNVAHITDTHLEENDETGNLDVAVVNQLASERWIDLIVHGGDIFNSYETGAVNGSQGITKDVAYSRIDGFLSNLKDVKCPIFAARGNHDVNGKYKPNYPDDQTVDTTQIISQPAFNMIVQRGIRGDIDGEYKCSFYKDFNHEKVRVILLDSYPTDIQSAAVTTDVMQFLVSALTLAEGKRDYAIVIFAHTFEGSVGTYYNPLITAFKNGGTFNNSKYGVTADFSAQGAGNFIGTICGHSHAETASADNGYWNIQTSTSYLKYNDAVVNNIYATVYTFDTDNHIIYKEKLGNGGISAAYNWDTLTVV